MTWQERATCLRYNPETWFPGGKNPDYADARAICSWCPVRHDCADMAMRREAGAPLRERHGMWGGLSELERHRLDKSAPRTVSVSLSDASRVIRQRLYDQGHTDAEIADRTGVTVAAVKQWRQKSGLAEREGVS